MKPVFIERSFRCRSQPKIKINTCRNRLVRYFCPTNAVIKIGPNFNLSQFTQFTAVQSLHNFGPHRAASLLLANLNNALNGLAFAPTPAYFGSASLQVTTNDLGQTGAGVPESDTDIISITVNEVNYNPVITSNGGGATASINVDENTTAVTTVTATDLDALRLAPGQCVRGATDGRSAVVVPRDGLAVGVEGVRFENVDFIWDRGSGAGAGDGLLQGQEAQQVGGEEPRAEGLGDAPGALAVLLHLAPEIEHAQRAPVSFGDPLGVALDVRVLTVETDRATVRRRIDERLAAFDKEVRGRLRHLREGTPEWEVEYEKAINNMRYSHGLN